MAMSTSNGDTACDSITVIDDDVLEGEHSFEIQIVSTDPMLSTINPTSSFVTVQDNEGSVLCYCDTPGDKHYVLLFLTDATILLLAPTAPVNEDVGATQICCAQITDLPSGGLGCPLIATLTLVNGAKAGV